MPIELNVIPVDDDDDLSNNYVVATDQGFYTPDDLNNLNFYLKHLNQAERNGASGTGLFSPFLRLNGDETLQGYNTSEEIPKNGQPPNQDDNHLDIDFSGDNNEGGDGHTVAFRLGDIPIVYLDLNEDGTAEADYQINLDINENNSTQVSLEELQIYTSDTVATLADYQLGGATDASDKGDAFLAADGFIKQFDLDANGDAELTLNDDSSGQGGNDYYFFIPISNFADADPTDFFTLYSQFGPTPADNAGFAEWNTLIAAQINGVKFNDHDGDGTQDQGVDEVLAGFTVYIDHNNNNLLDIDEQYTQSDVNGEFIFYSLLGNTNYTIREVLSLDDLSAALQAVLSDAQEEALLPPDGVWDQTTDPADDGDQVVAVTNPSNEYFVAVGNHELQPDIAIDKTASVPDDCADVVGELVSYTISVTNVGNVSLENVVVTDDFADDAPVYVSGDDNDGDALNGEVADGIMQVGETWIYSASHEVTQDDIDGNGNYDSDEDGTNDVLRNIATANADAVTTGEAAEEVTDDAAVPVCQDPELDIDKTASVPDDCADVVGELVSYTISVTNVGNVSLENVVVTDDFADDAPVYVSGDDNDGDALNGEVADGIMQVGETWIYSASHEVTQDDIDGNGNYDSDEDGTNDVLRNVATANADAVTTGEAAEEVTDDAAVPVCQDPELDIDKTASVPDDCADVVGELVSYTISVTNVGNVSLENVVVTDDFADDAPVYVSGDDNDGDALNGEVADGIMQVGETWIYSASHEVTQDDIDGNGNYDSDEDGTNDVLRNVATANADAVTTGEAAEEVTDDAAVPVCQDPSIDVEKTVKTDLNDYTDEDFDDDPDGLQASTSSKVTFRVVVTNTGNVTLANIALADSVVHTVNAIPGAPQDVVYTPDLNAATIDATDVFIDLNGNATLDDGEEWSNFDTDGDGTIDAGDAAELAPGETFTLYYSLDSQLGQHENTAEVTAAAATTGTVVIDADDANYFVLPSEDCVGVGTPGFWKNNGAAFWDGIANNEKHTGDPTVDGDSDPGFANGELLYAVDSDGVGGVDAFVDVNNDGVSDNAGLLIGDYNLNGLNDEGDAIFISLSDARMLIDASQKQLQDGKFMLGRDMVATWLNYLANGGPDGDCIGEASDTGSPRHYLDEAIDWMQTFGGLSGQNTNGGADTLTDNATGETFDTFFKGTLAVKTSASQWQSPVTDVAYDSAATLHGALDAYNNTGVIDETVYCCDRDDAAALLAISQIA